jgi:mitogen-activated protein kinase-activated protein kinase 5
MEGNFEFPVESVSSEVKDLIKKMIVIKPEDRITIPQMLNHPWVRDVEKSCLSGTEDDEQDL